MKPVLAIFKHGSPNRYCDETCYTSNAGRCVCICKGRNHGQGYARAVINSADLILEEAAIRTLFPNIKALDQLACNTDVSILIRKLSPLPDHVDP